MMLPCIFSDPTENIFAKKLNYFEVTLWALVSVIVLWGIWKMMAPYQPTVIDMPELRGVMQYKWFFYTVTGFGLLCLLIWPIYRNISVKLFFWVVLPLLLITGSIGVNINIWQRSKLDVYDKAAIVVKQLLAPEQLSRLVVVGDNPIEISRTLFYLDNPNVTAQSMAGGIEYIEELLPKDRKWVLVIGDRKISESFLNQNHFDGFSLIGGQGKFNVSFALADWPPSAISNISGVFIPPESWGSWSLGKKVVITFRQVLPEKFTLKLTGRAYGSNVNKDFILNCGENSYKFRMSVEFSEISIPVSNKTRARSISIEIPAPQSPKLLGTGEDDRNLGLGIRSFEINWN